MPAVSIVIPVYNAEQTLSRCLNSVAAQTFSDFECLLVNDGSSDQSAAILAGFARRDARFRVLSSENHGVSHARNMALARAGGEFLAFLDADDTWEPNALETLIAAIGELDVAVAHLWKQRPDGTLLPDSPPITQSGPQRLTCAQAAQIVFRGAPFGGHLHAKLFRRAPIASLRFAQDAHIYEDMLFVLSALAKAAGAVYAPTAIYHYTVSDGGAMGLALTPKKASSLIACAKMERLAQNFFAGSVAEAQNFSLRNALWLLDLFARADRQTAAQPWAKKTARDARRVIMRRWGRCVVLAPITPVQRAFCFPLALGTGAYRLFYRGVYRALKR